MESSENFYFATQSKTLNEGLEEPLNQFVKEHTDARLIIIDTLQKVKYGVECIAALHHNKRKTNYHIHLIFSERRLLDEHMEKIATRNMFYDETGKHVRTKKEILDEAGQLRCGCRIIPKGEVYERNIFTIKDSRFKCDSFLDEAKRSYTDLINIYVRDDEEKLKVFDKNGVYLPMKKVGKEFLTEYRASKAEYSDYQLAVSRWEQQIGNKAESDSIRSRLQQKQQEVKERENNRQSHYYMNDRGGR